MKKALISVSDKTGVVEFAKGLNALGFEIISTGGTFKTLHDAGVNCIQISDVTGFPECLDGRVKTLHPKIHAGLLAMRDNPEHMKLLKEMNIDTIDVVAVNLYPFKKTIEKPDVKLEEAVENIDIGGPAMLRSAAKNYPDVYVVVDPSDYQAVLDGLKNADSKKGSCGCSGTSSVDSLRFKLMCKVYRHTSVYDTLIANYMGALAGMELPDDISFAYEKAQDLRYGENPHQSAVFYKEMLKTPGSLQMAKQLHGKELSFNNINDTNGALDLLKEFKEPCVVAVKHTNPCGVGLGKNIYEAYMNAYNADTVSIFGGIIAANGIIDGDTAAEINKIFVEIVIAPGFTKEATDILAQKKNIRLLELPSITEPGLKGLDMKKVSGGLLVQQKDNKLFDELKVVTKKAPTDEQLKQMEFGYKIAKHTKSNAIVLVNDNMSVGMGIGQTNRIWAARQAVEHAGDRASGAVMASDAFFPFPDCVEEAHKAGIVAIIQPGGSMNDQLSIEACDKYGIAMVFCGLRHFKH